MTRLWTVLLVLPISLWSQVSLATPRCPSSHPALRERDPRERLTFIEQQLERERRPAQAWVGGFGGGLAGGTLLEVGALAAFPKDQQINYWIGAAGLAVGVVAVSTGALRPIANDAPLAAPTETMTDDEVCHLLAEAEGRLQVGASGEALSYSPLAHVATVLFNVGLFLWLGLGYGHWQSAGINLGVGLAIGEALIWTQPHALPNAYAHYAAGHI